MTCNKLVSLQSLAVLVEELLVEGLEAVHDLLDLVFLRHWQRDGFRRAL